MFSAYSSCNIVSFFTTGLSADMAKNSFPWSDRNLVHEFPEKHSQMFVKLSIIVDRPDLRIVFRTILLYIDSLNVY